MKTMIVSNTGFMTILLQQLFKLPVSRFILESVSRVRLGSA